MKLQEDLVHGGEHGEWMMWFLRHNLESLRASPFFHRWLRFSLKTQLQISKKKSFFLPFLWGFRYFQLRASWMWIGNHDNASASNFVQQAGCEICSTMQCIPIVRTTPRHSLSGEWIDRQPIQYAMRPEPIPQGGGGVITPSLLVGCGFLIIIYNQDELDNHCIMQWKSLLDANWLNAFLPSLQVLGFMYVVESFIIVVKSTGTSTYIFLRGWYEVSQLLHISLCVTWTAAIKAGSSCGHAW